jgi:DNA-binding SARP family transcriptional activator
MLSITLFGTTSATQEADGTEFTDFGGVKPRQILEILALAAGTPVPKDRLADLLWDGAPPRSYVGTLESYVCVLRRRLGCARGRAAAITTTSNGYLLDPRQVRVDLNTCRVLFAQAVASSPRTALQLVDDALALADGSLLASEPYMGWASREREVFTRELVIACTKASRHALDLGKHERAVELARTAVQHDRFAEEAWQQLIRALRACERKGEALRAYLDLRAVMVDELGVEPGPASHALYLEVLREEPTRSAADHDGHMEVRTLLGLLRQALESVPGVDVPKGDGALAAVAAQLVGVA